MGATGLVDCRVAVIVLERFGFLCFAILVVWPWEGLVWCVVWRLSEEETSKKGAFQRLVGTGSIARGLFDGSMLLALKARK
jgi:hypothetical protein